MEVAGAGGKGDCVLLFNRFRVSVSQDEKCSGCELGGEDGT